MIERRTDKTAFNLMQRTFDVLGSATSMLTIGEIARELHVEVRVIDNALDRLRRARCLRSANVDGQWRYGLRHGAERPLDRRGRRQLMQEIAA